MNSSHEQVVDYDPNWPGIYAAEVEKLKPIFGDSLVGIEHIGSTSVPGLAAKPIIDIAVLIKSHTEADNFIEPLAALSYPFDRDLHNKTEFPERHFFRKGSPTEFHLSIGYADKGGFWRRQILFRDYLRAHTEARDEYAKLKENLMKEDPTGGDKYISSKTDFILSILKKAGFN